MPRKSVHADPVTEGVGEPCPVSDRPVPDRRDVLEALRAQIRAIECDGEAAGPDAVPFGIEAIDRTLPWGGLPRGALHVVAPDEAGNGSAAASGFAAVLIELMSARRVQILHADGGSAYSRALEAITGEFLGDDWGTWVEWYDNGKKRSEGRYVDGTRDGQWTHWKKSGGVETQRMYKDGRVVR